MTYKLFIQECKKPYGFQRQVMISLSLGMATSLKADTLKMLTLGPFTLNHFASTLVGHFNL